MGEFDLEIRSRRDSLSRCEAEAAACRPAALRSVKHFRLRDLSGEDRHGFPETLTIEELPETAMAAAFQTGHSYQGQSFSELGRKTDSLPHRNSQIYTSKRFNVPADSVRQISWRQAYLS